MDLRRGCAAGHGGIHGELPRHVHTACFEQRVGPANIEFAENFQIHATFIAQRNAARDREQRDAIRIDAHLDRRRSPLKRCARVHVDCREAGGLAARRAQAAGGDSQLAGRRRETSLQAQLPLDGSCREQVGHERIHECRLDVAERCAKVELRRQLSLDLQYCVLRTELQRPPMDQPFARESTAGCSSLSVWSR